MNNILTVDKDAFSSGQVGSKLWLCEQLEALFDSVDTAWIYGGWYGMTAFLLRSRNNLQIGTIRSYDMDPACEAVADMLNENWVYKDWQFKAFTEDCNTLIPHDVDLVINTSTEHFESMDWFNNIPEGTVIAIQGNNMPHEDHHVHSKNLGEFCKMYPLSKTLYQGSLDFTYPTWKFTRFMHIGIK